MRIRSTGQGGFTLVEMLVTLSIMGVLLSVAPLSFAWIAARASSAVAVAEVRSALPVVERYRAQNGDSFEGMSKTALRALDSSVDVEVLSASTDAYCIRSIQRPWHYRARLSDVSETPCN